MMLNTLISSKTRVKLLLKFFLNSNTTAYLRGLESEFGESTNSIRLELNRLEEAGMLASNHIGNRKFFKANTKHPLFKEIHNILLKHIGIDRIIEDVVERLGDVEKVFLVGDFAKGINSRIIDLVFIGNIDKQYLLNLIEKAETLVNRKIKYLIYNHSEFELATSDQKGQPSLLVWSRD